MASPTISRPCAERGRSRAASSRWAAARKTTSGCRSCPMSAACRRKCRRRPSARRTATRFWPDWPAGSFHRSPSWTPPGSERSAPSDQTLRRMTYIRSITPSIGAGTPIPWKINTIWPPWGTSKFGATTTFRFHPTAQRCAPRDSRDSLSREPLGLSLLPVEGAGGGGIRTCDQGRMSSGGRGSPKFSNVSTRRRQAENRSVRLSAVQVPSRERFGLAALLRRRVANQAT